MGLQAIYRAPRTSDPHPEHRVYPYLLRGLMIERANHVWCADITYIPVRRGFLYLAAIMDWASRHVLAWRLSNTLDAGFCTDALDEALARHSTPEIFNTDQGSQFTGFAFTGRLREAGIRISMDGRGRYLDNIFIERLWRSLKYEAVYLRELADGFEARRVIGEWIDFYNTERPHSALGGKTPAEAYRGAPPVDMMDKPLRDVAAMADHLGTDLYQLLPQRGQRPVLNLLRQSQRPHEVGEIVGQGVKLQPDGVIAEPATRQPRPFDRVLAFLDALLRFAPLILEQCHPLGRSRQVGDDEPDPGKQLAGVPLHLGDDAAGLIPAFGPIAEAGVMAPHMVWRTANGSREQMADAFQKNLVLRQTDRAQEALVFQKLIDVR